MCPAALPRFPGLGGNFCPDVVFSTCRAGHGQETEPPGDLAARAEGLAWVRALQTMPPEFSAAWRLFFAFLILLLLQSKN